MRWRKTAASLWGDEFFRGSDPASTNSPHPMAHRGPLLTVHASLKHDSWRAAVDELGCSKKASIYCVIRRSPSRDEGEVGSACANLLDRLALFQTSLSNRLTLVVTGQP
jgi:hypothetical protein